MIGMVSFKYKVKLKISSEFQVKNTGKNAFRNK